MPPRRQFVDSVMHSMSELRSDYRAGQDTRFRSRLTGVNRAGSGADYHYRSEARFLYMLEFSRELERNDQLVKPAIRRLVDNVVQDGFTPDPNTGDKLLDADLKAGWQEWASDPDQCHSEGELDFHQMERLVFKHTIVDGDLLVLPLKDDGSLQFVESHRLRTPRNTTKNVVHGILLDDDGRRQEYWVTKEDLDPLRALGLVRDTIPYPARQPDGERAVWHVFDPGRLSQRRGVPAIAPVGDTAGQLDDLQFAALVAAQLQACFAILRQIPAAEGNPLDGAKQKGPQSLETMADGVVKVLEGVSPGLEVIGRPGETLQGFSPTIPGTNHFQHSLLLTTYIAINLDLPVAVLLLDPSNTNFSGWRGAIDQARMSFRPKQQHLIRKFHAPAWRHRIRYLMAGDAAMKRAAEREGIHIFRHRWHPPEWRYIEPLKDAAADLLQLRNGLNSQRRIQAQRGRDWEEIFTEIIEDNALAIVAAKKKADELKILGIDVHWRELLPQPTAEGIRINFNSGDSEAEPASGDGRGGAQNRLAHLPINGNHG